MRILGGKWVANRVLCQLQSPETLDFTGKFAYGLHVHRLYFCRFTTLFSNVQHHRKNTNIYMKLQPQP
nr:MAG TPA: hypothetical protein [Caudoviricetes sp.]